MVDSTGKNDQGGANRPPTSQDVAKKAQVSRATVSFVLNNTPDARISEKTRQNVLKAAAELGYVPHYAAKSLRSMQSDLVLLPFFDWPYNQDSIHFLQIFARKLDQEGFTVMHRYFGKSRGTELAARIAAMHPIGVFFESTEMAPDDIAMLRRHGVKALFAMDYGERKYADLPSIVIDFTEAGRLVAEHFIGEGHRRIGVVVPEDPRIRSMGVQRYEGIRRTAEQAGVSVDRFDLDFSLDSAASLVESWRSKGPPSALFTYNDEFGMLFMRVLKDHGFAIPGDIALVGCDDLPMCVLLSPRLSSVSMGMTDSADGIAEEFIKLIRNPDLSDPVLSRPNFELVIRESG
jgi:DNA-binding LacI/PurR family transcriptional regulator